MSNSSTKELTKGSQALRADKANGSTDAKSFPWITRNSLSTPKFFQHSDVPPCKFMNFVTILGPARQGKSFLMNCLIGESVFGTADTIGVCTKGINVASVRHEVGNEGCAFFVDTEGQGNKHAESDITLLTPVLLLSKVILFNWKGGMQVNQILNQLVILVEVAKRVQADSIEDNTPILGCLNIVLRDFHYQGTKEDVFNMIFHENIEYCSDEVNALNTIRQKLLSSFEDISIFFFSLPGENLCDLNPKTTSKKFKEDVRQLKKKILRQMSEPRKFGANDVTSQNVDDLVRIFVKKLEDGKIIHVKSAVMQYQHEEINKEKHCFEENLEEYYKKIDVPVKDGLKKKLTEKTDALLETFKNKTANIDLEVKYREEVLELLKHFARKRMDDKMKQNQLAIKATEAEQRETLMKSVETFKSAVESEIKNCEMESTDMKQYFEDQINILVDRFKANTAQLDWIQEMVQDKLKEVKNWADKKCKEKVQATKRSEQERGGWRKYALRFAFRVGMVGVGVAGVAVSTAWLVAM